MLIFKLYYHIITPIFCIMNMSIKEPITENK